VGYRLQLDGTWKQEFMELGMMMLRNIKFWMLAELNHFVVVDNLQYGKIGDMKL
jgi:hypothetical protein